MELRAWRTAKRTATDIRPSACAAGSGGQRCRTHREDVGGRVAPAFKPRLAHAENLISRPK